MTSVGRSATVTKKKLETNDVPSSLFFSSTIVPSNLKKFSVKSAYAILTKTSLEPSKSFPSKHTASIYVIFFPFFPRRSKFDDDNEFLKRRFFRN